MPILQGFLVVSLEPVDNGGGPVTRCQRGVPTPVRRAVSVIVVLMHALECLFHLRDSLGGLTLGYPLGLQGAILLKQISALEPRPSLRTLCLATLFGMDYSAHKLPPLPKPLPCEKWRAKDGEVATWLQARAGFELFVVSVLMDISWPTP
jgi:hypothetical protein